MSLGNTVATSMNTCSLTIAFLLQATINCIPLNILVRRSPNIRPGIIFAGKDFLIGLYNRGGGGRGLMYGGLMYGGLIHGPHLVLVIFTVPVNYIVNENKYKQTICNT